MVAARPQSIDGVTVDILTSLPPGTFESSGLIRSYPDDSPLSEIGPPFHYPELQLRHYAGGVTVAPGMLLHTSRSVLPDSFKWQGQHLHQPKMKFLNEGYGRLRSEPQGVPSLLRGDYYYFDYAHLGHYGHLLTEGICKLWGWRLAKQQFPDLKLLIRTHWRDSARSRPRPDIEVLRAYGVTPQDCVWVDGPVLVESLVSASQMWHNNTPYWAHPEMREVWERIRRGFATFDHAPPQDFGERVFITRRGGNRECHNCSSVEQVFSAHGFRVVYPGGMSPTQQALCFRKVRVLAGFGGTGMFNMIFAEHLSDVIVLNQRAYHARNEHLMAALSGADLHYFWSDADIQGGQNTQSYEAHQSPWSFDFETNGHTLRSLLATLT